MYPPNYVFTFLQVLWLGVDDCHATWELEKDIPANLIKEFEESTAVDVETIAMRSLGQTSNILNVIKHDSTKPQIKKCKMDRHTVAIDDG